MLDECFEVLDERFLSLVMINVHLEKLYTGCRWSEGPAYFAGGRYLIWSDIPNDRMMRFDETDGSVSVFRQPALHSNGNSVDLQGRLVTCEHAGRCVSRTDHDGIRRVLVSQVSGKPLNSPNDLVVKSDGTIWFTDPSYGIDTDYEGHAAVSEIGACHVYRYDPRTGGLTVVASDFDKPNGIAFSSDESCLFIADSGATHSKDGPCHIRRFIVAPDGSTLEGGEIFARCTAGVFDGFRLDTRDNIWTSAADGVHCLAPDGTLIGKIRVPEVVANVCFGGVKRNRLFICGTTSLYAVFVNAAGATARAYCH